jgi:mannose/cellobiose epimerase-like protein (N-acyl-D-glucosamine 2-epimerase family)
MDFNATQMRTLDWAGVRSIVPDHEAMLATVLRAIVDRHERHADYPFIDTKLSMLTGQDFTEPADATRDFKGKTAVFCWIQGRGLESLVGHARWLPKCSALKKTERDELGARLRKMIERVFAQMEVIRARNHGRLFFLMTPDGRAFDVDDEGRRRFITIEDRPHNMSDMFYVKGMLAAADYLNKPGKVADAKDCFRCILTSITGDTFRSDAISFDPKNRPVRVPGKHFHGSRMIALGALALFTERTGDDEWFDTGEQFIRYIVERHINTGQHQDVELHDMWEGSDAEGRPWRDDGKVVCDPGHANEFVGLAAKLLLLLQNRKTRSASEEKLLADCRELFPRVLLRNFRNGYNTKVGGLCKAFDLLSRKPINSDMPWWNLPETIRAAAEVLVLCPNCPQQSEIFDVLAKSSNAFFKNFVNPKIHLMAYQTINEAGQPIDVIPATADADPGYHTGLSIIDFLHAYAASR